MRRSTGIYIVILLLLAGLYFYLKDQPESVDTEATAEPTAPPIEYLFTPEDGLPTSIRIESQDGEVVEVARNEENAWALILPEEAAADQGLVEAAASQVATMRILDRIPDLSLEASGLDNPQYRISLQFTSGMERTIEIGVLTPTGRGYYTRSQDNATMIVSNSALDALLGLLTNPPYAPTEAPPPATP